MIDIDSNFETQANIESNKPFQMQLIYQATKAFLISDNFLRLLFELTQYYRRNRIVGTDDSLLLLISLLQFIVVSLITLILSFEYLEVNDPYFHTCVYKNNLILIFDDLTDYVEMVIGNVKQTNSSAFSSRRVHFPSRLICGK